MESISQLESLSSSDDDSRDGKRQRDYADGEKNNTRDCAGNGEDTMFASRVPNDPTRNQLGRQNNSASSKRAKNTGSVEIISFSKAPSDTFVRAVPHRRGHWMGHIRIPVTDLLLKQQRRYHIQQLRQCLERQGHSGVLVEHDEDLHVSLSKPFSLQVSQIESFVQQLSQRIQQEIQVTTSSSSFLLLHVDCVNGQILVNEEETRSFWCWTVRPHPTLMRLVSHVDAVLKKYQQPLYYDPPHFHISIASFPGKVDMGVMDAVNKGMNEEHCKDEDDGSSMSGNLQDIATVRVDRIQCNFGTTEQFTIPLYQKEMGT